MGNWMPDRESDFAELCNKWVTILNTENIETVYGWNKDDEMATSQKISAFLAARQAYTSNDSSVNRISKDVAKREAMTVMREFANTSIRYNKNMDEAAKKKFGIMPRDTTPTVHSRPGVQPSVVVETTPYHYQHKLVALNVESGKKTKPAGVHGVCFAWQIGGERPASGSELPRGKFSRKTEIVVNHTEAEKGKVVYYASCYENARGEAGPWSPVTEAYIA